MPASELSLGDRLVSSVPSEIACVTGVSDNGEVEHVHNLRVPGAHTYFVGHADQQCAVLVHNQSEKEGSSDEPPEGNEGNNFNGVGEWKLNDSKGAEEFLAKLLQVDKNKLPDDWATVAKDGCVGLNLMRIGYAGDAPLGARCCARHRRCRFLRARVERGRNWKSFERRTPVSGTR